MFVSSLTPDAVSALKATYRQLPKKLVDFIRERDAGLPPAASAVARGRLPKLGRPLYEKRGALQCNSDFLLIARSSKEPLCQHTSGDGRDAGDENEHKRELTKEIAGKPWPK